MWRYFEIGSNTLGDYFMALLTGVAIIVVIKIIKSVLISRLLAVAGRTQNKFDDAIAEGLSKIKAAFYIITAIYVAAQSLIIVPSIDRAIYYMFVITATLQVIVSLQAFLRVLIKEWVVARQPDGEPPNTNRISLLTKLAGIFLWLVGLMLILTNLGYEIGPLLAGLGIGGIAVALAAQAVLEDVFASFSIYFDKPFEIGDFIIVGERMGTVKRIGIKTTRLNSLQGEEIVFSNKELTSTVIQNFKKMRERRISFTLGLTYETTIAKLKEAKEIVSAIIKDVPSCRLDRVNWKSFGDFSLDFEVVYYLDTNDYNVYMDKQELINWQILERFNARGIDFAYPTQTVKVDRD
ncbi:MAG: mechanosensitive ion channel family protein [Candidatus Komeilibacteria bacterium]|nr:mechanosensitive ion channel family protein [Candidatus Komeilibacteria bacterium]